MSETTEETRPARMTIELPLKVNELAALASSIQGVYPDAEIANKWGTDKTLGVFVDEEPTSEEPAPADPIQVVAEAYQLTTAQVRDALAACAESTTTEAVATDAG